jgi:hypothetical protein
MKFQHTYTVYTCTKCKSYSHTTKGATNWSKFYLCLAFGMAFPLWIYSMISDMEFPWYYIVCIISLELLLFYIVSFIAGFFLIFYDSRPSCCPNCKAPLTMNGSYYSDGEKMNVGDIFIAVLYVLANIGIWVYITTNPW